MARRVKLSVAKKAVDSTLRRILSYTAEIIMSIILLVLICIPLAFVIPMWFQTIGLGVPRNELSLDPVHWIGADGTVWLILILSLVSFVLAYAYILKMKPGIVGGDEPKEEDEPEDDEEEEEPEAVEEEELEEVVEAAPEVEEEEPLEEEAEEIASEDVTDEETEEED